MVGFAPSDFYLAHPTTTFSPEQLRRWEEQQKFVKLQTEYIRETTGTKTVPVETVVKEGQPQIQTKVQTLQEEIGKQMPKEVFYGAALGIPVAVSVVAPPVGIPMLVGEVSSMGVTGAIDVLEDVLKQRPIKIDYPVETYVASGIGGQVAGLVGAYVSPFAISGLAKFGAGGLIATWGCLPKI